MKKLLLASGALVALIAAGPAVAADQGIRAPAPAYAPPVSDWTGFYVGGHAGYGWGHDPFTDNSGSQSVQGNPSGVQVFNVNPVTLTDINPNGAVGGLHFGYNQQWGNWVGGLEVDISATDMKGSTAGSSTGTVSTTTTSVVAIPTPPFVTTTTTTTTQNITNSAGRSDKFDLLGSARARIGGLIWSNTLLYGTGGLAWTRFVPSQTFTQTVAAVGFPTSVASFAGDGPAMMFGWVAGVGGETKIYNSNWLFRVEYLHYDFGNQGSAVASAITPQSSSAATNLTQGTSKITGTLTADVVRAGLSYKFGGPIY